MIPAEFDYAAPESLEEAISLLAVGGEETKILAGGHSLLPLMKYRLATPEMLVDIRKVPGLNGVQRENGSFRIGAMTTHATLQTSPELGVICEAAGSIADQMVRNRGTIGGSLAHGDPASDLPAIIMACGGSVTVQGPGGQREIHVRDLFQDYLQTAIGSDEVLTEIRVESMDGYGYGYEKFARRAEDWAMAAVSALVKVTDGVCDDVRIGLTHMSSVPLRGEAVEQALRGQPLDAERIRQAADLAAEGTDPPGDLNATPEYKRHLTRVMCRRALTKAAGL